MSPDDSNTPNEQQPMPDEQQSGEQQTDDLKSGPLKGLRIILTRC
jgi:hypothetical protein